MSEATVVRQSREPLTLQNITNKFRELGLKEGMTVIVHSSLSSFGYVVGGPITIVKSLMDIITDQGTIIMPTHTSDYSDPAIWGCPPVPEEWWETIRQSMPAFDPIYTPTREMGKVVEVFRTMPKVIRSNHPTYSFAAWGREAEEITKDQPFDYPMGENSPLSRIYDLDGYVLLLGVGYNTNTSFHLAEYRQNVIVQSFEGAPINEGDKTVWKTYQNVEFETDDFPLVGKSFEKNNVIQQMIIGNSICKLFSQRQAVDFAVQWLNDKK